MKSIQLFTILALMFAFSFGSFGQTPSYSFLVNQVFSIEKSEKVLIDLPEAQCQVIETNSRRITVEQHISANIGNHEMVKFLTKREKYHLKIQVDLHFRTSTLTLNKDKGIVFVNGVELLVQSTYIIYIPNSVGFSFITSSDSQTKTNGIAVLE